MDKSLLQKKFRFVMIVAALALFLTIVLPAYFRGGNSKSMPGVIMMWTVLFGAGDNISGSMFDFSWIAFIGYSVVIVLLLICLARKFITVDTKTNSKKGSIALDAICMICCLVALVMFIILPITITDVSTHGGGIYYVTHAVFGISYILAYILLAVMFISSLIVLYAESIAKFAKLKQKNAKKDIKENKNDTEDKE